ncbi:MAG: divergent polysaccharide deacetylase family protein [Magnetococcales bacterium]|nr:divergent polysaccharide deacetylase family protein [Magnetococcales bacterium]
MEDMQENQPDDNKLISGLMITSLLLLVALVVVIYLGWKPSEPLLEVATSTTTSEVASTNQVAEKAQEVSTVAGGAAATATSKEIADSASLEGSLASEESLGTHKSLIFSKSLGASGVNSTSNATSSAVKSASDAISSVVESASMTTPLTDEAFKHSVPESATLTAEPTITAKPEVKAASPNVDSITGASKATPGDLIYEEHLAETDDYPEPDPEIAPPKRTFRPRAKMIIALVIDDLGYNVRISKSIARLPADVTLAVLPGGKASQDVVNIAKATGKELILHQPMQPRGFPGVNPGPKALLDSMEPSMIRQVLKENLAEFSTAVGINNHMGSFLTTKKAAMDAVMEVLAEANLFFLDSRTSVATVAEKQARLHGIPAVRRDVFIDNNQDKASILKQLLVLEALAAHNPVVGIGHPYPGTLAALKEWLPTLEAKGIVLARVSQLITPESARSLYPYKPAGPINK